MVNKYKNIQNNALDKAIAEKRDAEQLLRFISPKYMGVYVLDRETDYFHDILGPDYFRSIVKDREGKYSEGLRIYGEKFVIPEDQHVITEVVDYDSLYADLQTGKSKKYFYRKTDGTMVSLEITRYSDKEDEANLSLWIYVDDGITYKKQLGMADSAANALHAKMTSALWFIDYDEKGQMRQCTWSNAFRQILGYDSYVDFPDTWEAWVAKIHPEDREYVEKSYDEVLNDYSGESNYDIEYRMCNKQREYHWFRDTAHVSRQESGLPICVSGLMMLVDDKHEINAKLHESLETEKKQRKLLEKHQKQSEELFAIFNALSSNYMNVFMIDLNNRTARVLKLDGYVTTGINKRSRRYFSYDQVLRQYISERVHLKDKEQMYDALSIETICEKLKDSNEYTGSYRVLIRDEVHYYQFKYLKLEKFDYVIAAYQNVDDITNDMKLRNAQMEALCMDYTVVYTCDLMKDTISVVKMKTFSHSYHHKDALTSYTNWIKYAFDNIMVQESAPAFVEDYDRFRLMEYLKDHDSLIMRHKTKPNELGTEYFEVRAVPIFKDVSSFQIMLAYRPIDDIVKSEKKQQEQLKLALEAAEQSSKAKSVFLSSMSHDIRTPMNAIVGFTALARTHMDNKEMVSDYLAKINISSTHLLSLINDILDMSRIESGSVKLEENIVHLPTLLHDLRNMIQGMVNAKQQNLYIDTQDIKNEDIVTDKLRLNQVLLNIISNAIKFTKPGGDIIIRMIEKPCQRQGYSTYEFSIKDNGIGMSPKFVQHVFDTFAREQTTTVNGIQGTGLGMAITKNIVEMMGGTIEVESHLGKGSLFTVTLDVKVSGKAIVYDPIPELMGARVLVIDDDINTCRSVSKMLREINMRPDWTVSGRESILRVQDAVEANDEYKVYIVDYLMPDMNGIETVRRIRKHISKEVPIIVLTAYDWNDFENEARDAGVTAFVSKPIFMSELRAVLTKSEIRDKSEIGKPKDAAKVDYTGKRALLVEDNELNREIATAMLEDSGMKIDIAHDGIEAVNIIYDTPADTYDLIFMDVQMPRMDGYTATREIRTMKDNRKANIPIVAMTANAFEEDRRKAFETGMNAHIAKPLDMKIINETLEAIFASKSVE